MFEASSELIPVLKEDTRSVWTLLFSSGWWRPPFFLRKKKKDLISMDFPCVSNHACSRYESAQNVCSKCTSASKARGLISEATPLSLNSGSDAKAFLGRCIAMSKCQTGLGGYVL
ncbi:hypothetical protein PoB_003131200 [Plakobranchus ocellatus]|uniref:Uncharacterized protein n=1 Tax=Plakobranchus ocellatus TaxID=259542 RepID=A0AAV4AC22_9GAST|nr:hypothetical protein PoB_003131200 [Plakobranchus ocellatus]